MKAPGNQHHRGSPLLFPTAGASPGSGVNGLGPSSHQIGAESARFNKEMQGYGDQAETPQSLATIAPTSNIDHMAGVALRGLKRAAGI